MALDIYDYPLNVRQRPGMWIGKLENCNIMLKELVDNAEDEYLSGRNDTISIKINELSENLNQFIVADKSTKGFSLDEAKMVDGTKINRTEMDAAINKLSSSTKFNKTESAIGMNGVGSAVVNALSKKYVSISNLTKSSAFNPENMPDFLKKEYKNQKYYYLEYSEGNKVKEEFIDELPENYKGFEDYTTIASFIPDLSIMMTSNYSIPKGLDYVIKESKIKGDKLNVFVNDEVYESKLEDYKYTFNIKIKGQENTKNPSIRLYGSFELSKDIFDSKDLGSVNAMACHKGKHITIFRKAYKDAIKELYGDLGGNEAYGLYSYVFLMANEVDFDSQSKKELERITDFDESNLYQLKDLIKNIMKENDEEFRNHYQKILNFRMKKGELNKKQQINKLLGIDVGSNSTKSIRRAGSYVPNRCKDAWSQNRKKCELLLFEGKSAMNSAFKTRNPEFQALFPMRGVPLNTSKFNIIKVLKNKEMRDLFKSMGAGVDGNCNLKKLRYDRIVYYGDADEDGFRIIALIVGVFGCHAKFLIDSGKLYIGETPLYIQDGKFIYTDEKDKLDHKKPFKRIKGLGGLGKYFGDCVTNPNTRRLKRITPEMLAEAIQILKSGSKKKELLLKTGVVSTELYKG